MEPDDYVMISALQHYIFCPRRCYLIHVEGVWAENYFTAAGQIMHQRIDEMTTVYVAPGIREVHALTLRSDRLRVCGRADTVEFNDNEHTVYPVEYKLGRPHADDVDKVQLCAQAYALEEMLHVSIPNGALFYGKTRHRLEIAFTPELRARTEQTAAAVHQLLSIPDAPKPSQEKEKCELCSLRDLCLEQLRVKTDVMRYIDSQLDGVENESEAPDA